MKAIIIKDDRDIKFWDIENKVPELYFARPGKIEVWKEELKTANDSIPIYKEIYELIHIRTNGDLVYRLKR